MRVQVNKRSRSKNITAIFIGTLVVLAVPLIAMQFTDQVQWGPLDFLIMGLLLFGTGLAYELLSTRLPTATQRAIFAVVVLVILLAVWAELAVGIFGTPFAGS